MVIKSINNLGRYTQNIFGQLGTITLFLYEATRSFIKHGVSSTKLLAQMNSVGVNSLSVIALTGVSIGSVMAWQTHVGLKNFGTYEFIGPIVFMGMVRELGPVLSAIMVAGRAGSAMTAEIGTMQITEQVDALRTLGINVKQYLIVPRIVGTTLMMPLLSLFCSLCGVMGGYAVAVFYLKVNPQMYLSSIRQNVMMKDIFHGLIKSTVFGFLLATIATFKGFKTRGGAKNVGISTTQSVVNACLTTFVVDFILTALI